MNGIVMLVWLIVKVKCWCLCSVVRFSLVLVISRNISMFSWLSMLSGFNELVGNNVLCNCGSKLLSISGFIIRLVVILLIIVGWFSCFSSVLVFLVISNSISSCNRNRFSGDVRCCV